MKRYPGIRPFRTDEKGLFFGRDADIERLYRLIGLEQLVILYGKSGYGKSSLLSAGIFPRLQAEGLSAEAPAKTARRFWEIRFGPHKPGDSLPPAENLRQAIARTQHDPVNPVDPVHKKNTVQKNTPVQPLSNVEPSVWLSLKYQQQTGPNNFLLVFDQFEELFTYPAGQILDFKKQLAEALYSKVPKRYQTALAAAGLSPEQEDALYAPFDLKVVFSIRSDRMSLLNGLKDYLPNLLQHGYELEALDEEQARAAVVLPAGLHPSPSPSPRGEGGLPPASARLSENEDPNAPIREGQQAILSSGISENEDPNAPIREGQQIILSSGISENEDQYAPVLENRQVTRHHAPLPPGGGAGGGVDFDSPPFTYAPDTLAAIFAALRNDRGRIETSALQIVCKHVEDHVAGAPDQVIQPADLGDIKSIFRQFYERTIAGLPDAQQETARRAVEDLLIKDGARIPYAAQALLAVPGVTPDLLDRLAAASLLRVERDEQGRMLYEVGHDTLVAPISEAAQARRAEEEKIRLQAEADEQRREKEKAVAARRRAIGVAIGAILLSLLAIAASCIAYLKSREASAQAAIILEKEKQVDANVRIAREKTAEAAGALKRAEEKEEEARLKNEEVQRQKNATEEQKRRATLALQQAQEERRTAEEATVKVVQSLLDNASAAIYRLDYETARDRLHDAADLTSKKPFDNPLGKLRPVVADSLMELAWFYTETDNTLAAMFEISVLSQVLARPNPADALHDRTVAAKTADAIQSLRAAVRDTLRQMRPLAFRAMEERYYPVLLPVPGGTYYPGKNYQVGLSDFRLARTETTVWQYNLYLVAQGKDIFDDKTISRPGWGWEGDNPIVNVSWFDACLYANWLSRRFRLHEACDMGEMTKGAYSDYYKDITLDTAANGFRLPTEAEWEFAARGGAAGLRDSFEYAGSNQLDRVGWYSENSGNRARPVAQKLPNQLNLYDMSGNVWEWCWDWYADYPSDAAGPVMNPYGPAEGDTRVLRGGSWFDDDGSCGPGGRYGYVPDVGNYDWGFRVGRH